MSKWGWEEKESVGGGLAKMAVLKKPSEIPLACKLIQRHLSRVIPYV